MDDLLFANYTPDHDGPDSLTADAGTPKAQAASPEPIGRSRDFDVMLDELLLELGEYGSFADASATPDLPADADAPSAPAEDGGGDIPAADTKAAPPAHAILGADEKPEEEPELESAYIRRVARRAAQRAPQEDDWSRTDSAQDADADGADEDNLYELDSEIAEELDDYRERRERKSGLAEKLAGPLVRFLATRKAREKLREQEASAWPTPVDIRQTPELPPRKAARYYGSQVYPLGTRLYILLFLTLVLAWIGFRFPLAGQLCQNTRMQAAVSLVFLLTAMLCALDVVSTGIRQIFRLQPSLQALCAASCLASCLDALLVAFGLGSSLPFCAVSAASLAAALWGEKLECIAQDVNLSTAAQSRESSILSAEEDGDGLHTLVRSDRAHDGIVRRSEEPNCLQDVYAAAAPILLVAAPLLAVLSVLGRSWVGLFHNLSAYLAVCSNMSGFLGFALPYLMAVLRLRRSGAAIAGWSGCADIGRSHRVIIKDTDLFPPGTIRLEQINILADVNAEKVVSYTVSMLARSGSSVTEAFSDLMQYRRYSLVTVEEFNCHDGGGFSAYIHNEHVLVGSQGFLNLMGIRLPQDLHAESSVCIAISNELVGVFDLTYGAAPGVRKALDLLLLGRVQPVFAIRDFNITPLTIQSIFHIPAINFEFPSFRERYRLSSLFGSDETPPAAVLLRPNVRCAVETADRGRRLYTACIAAAALSVFGVVLGLLIVFLSLRSGGTAALGAGRLLLYSLLWLLPMFGLAYWTLR